jgi:sorbitol-specific phosphotransferase system component IIA
VTDYYKGDRIAELLEELRHCELVFNSANAEELNDELRMKLIAAKAHVAITKAKLTSLQD